MGNTASRSGKTNNMTQGNAVKHILLFAFPIFVGTVFQQFYNLADSMIASHNLGEAALAAIGATSAVYSLMIFFSNGLNSGYGLLISRAFGADDKQEIQKQTATMIVLNAGITGILTAASLLLISPLMRWLNTPDEIYVRAHTYIVIILAGLAATVLYNMCAGFLQALGNSRIPLIFLLISCVINLLLDFLFIIVLKTDVGGAALATVLAQGISGLLSAGYIVRNYRDYLPKREHFLLESHRVQAMFSAGMSMALMMSVFQIGSVILQRAINDLGTDIITAHTASRRIYELLMMPMSALSTANATFVSQNFGAGKLARIDAAMKKVIGLECVWAEIAVVLCFTVGAAFIQLVSASEKPYVLENAMLNLKCSTCFFWSLAILIVIRTSMQAMGEKIAPLLSSGIELGMKLIASLFVIPKRGYFYVAVLEPVIWCVCALYLYLVFRRVRKNVGRLLSGEEQHDD